MTTKKINQSKFHYGVKTNIIKTTLIIIALILFLLPNFVVSAEADSSPTFDAQLEAFAGKEGVGLEKPIDPRIMVAQMIKIFISVIGLLFLLYAIYAGYLIMSSAGDEDKVKRGKSTLRTAIIGIFIALSSYGLLYLISEIALRSTGERPDAYFDFDVDIQDYYR